MERMDVCFLMPVFDVFKGGNHLPLLREMHGVGFTILTNRTKPESPSLPPNVRVMTLGERLGPYYYGCADWRFAQAILRKYPPHASFWQQFGVIHLNQTMGTGLMRLRECGRPMLYAVHHPVTVDRVIAVQESSFLDGWKWRAKYALLVHWQRHLCRHLPHIMTVSHTVARRLEQDYGCDPSRISVVHNGVDGDMFSLASDEPPVYDLIAVGSLMHPRKGFGYLLEVYRSLAQEGYCIADVGRRSAEQQQAIDQIKGVTRHGMVEHDKLVSLIRNSAALVSTSLYEGFGLSLIEALSCGRPAFAFGVGAVPEVLSSIDETLFVPACDTDALIERIRTFLSLPLQERSALGCAYREKVLARYSLQQSVAQLRALYDALRG